MMPTLCTECERRLHEWMAGTEKNAALCLGCAWRLNDWLAKPENAWVREQLPREGRP